MVKTDHRTVYGPDSSQGGSGYSLVPRDFARNITKFGVVDGTVYSMEWSLGAECWR